MANVRRNRRAEGRLTARKPVSNTRRERLPRRVLALLAEPLDPALISERGARDGRLLQYIEGWAVINQANRIFGYDGWGAESVGEAGYRPVSLIDPATDEALAVGMYTAAVRVTVRGCPARSDVGCAFVADDTPEAHEAAYKGAVTDALKRALRHFGEQFGNGLYDRRNVIDAASPAVAPASLQKLEEMRRKVLELSERLGVEEAGARSWVEQRYHKPLDELGEQSLADAVRSLAEQLNARNSRNASGPSGQRKAA
jgi:DNA recombination protein Rad52